MYLLTQILLYTECNRSGLNVTFKSELVKRLCSITPV